MNIINRLVFYTKPSKGKLQLTTAVYYNNTIKALDNMKKEYLKNTKKYR